MEARLLVRYIDSIDRRKTTLVLTKKAEKLLVALSEAHRKELRRIGPLLRSVLARLEH